MARHRPVASSRRNRATRAFATLAPHFTARTAGNSRMCCLRTTIRMSRSSWRNWRRLLGITDSETLRTVQARPGSRILDHGVPRSPAGGTATLIIDRLPFFSARSFAGLLPGSAWLVLHSATRSPVFRSAPMMPTRSRAHRKPTSRRPAAAFRHCCAVALSAADRRLRPCRHHEPRHRRLPVIDCQGSQITAPTNRLRQSRSALCACRFRVAAPRDIEEHHTR